MSSRIILAVCGGCLLALASAQALELGALPDPTRPPTSMARGEGAALPAGPGAAVAARAASAASAPPAAPARPRLTLIRLDVNGRGVALIDGRLLSVGDRVGDAVLASIDAQGVVLRGARGWQRLPLIAPAASNKAVTPTSAVSEHGGKESE